MNEEEQKEQKYPVCSTISYALTIATGDETLGPALITVLIIAGGFNSENIGKALDSMLPSGAGVAAARTLIEVLQQDLEEKGDMDVFLAELELLESQNPELFAKDREECGISAVDSEDGVKVP